MGRGGLGQTGQLLLEAMALAPLPRAAPPGTLSIAEHPLNAARRRSNDLIDFDDMRQLRP